MQKYSMEASTEAERLESQIYQENYRLDSELGRFRFSANEHILDAGCGTGVTSRYLASRHAIERIEGCDSSELRIHQARTITASTLPKSNISYLTANLEHMPSHMTNRYDTIICRYVLEHCQNPALVLGEFHRAIRPGGRLILIDLDGVFNNLYSTNERFNFLFNQLKTKMTFDLHVGRKIPALLNQNGFHEIGWDVELLNCKGRRLIEEYENTQKRFEGLKDYLANSFDSHDLAEEFSALYLQEMLVPHNTLVFTKFICWAKKKQ